MYVYICICVCTSIYPPLFTHMRYIHVSKSIGIISGEPYILNQRAQWGTLDFPIHPFDSLSLTNPLKRLFEIDIVEEAEWLEVEA